MKQNSVNQTKPLGYIVTSDSWGKTDDMLPIVFARLIAEKKLKPFDQEVHGWIGWHVNNNKAYPSIDRLAAITKKNARTVMKAIDRLVEHGLLIETIRPGTSTLYTVIGVAKGKATPIAPPLSDELTETVALLRKTVALSDHDRCTFGDVPLHSGRVTSAIEQEEQEEQEGEEEKAAPLAFETLAAGVDETVGTGPNPGTTTTGGVGDTLPLPSPSPSNLTSQGNYTHKKERLSAAEEDVARRLDAGFRTKFVRSKPETLEAIRHIAEREAQGERLEVWLDWAIHERRKQAWKYAAWPRDIITEWSTAFTKKSALLGFLNDGDNDDGVFGRVLTHYAPRELQ